MHKWRKYFGGMLLASALLLNACGTETEVNENISNSETEHPSDEVKDTKGEEMAEDQKNESPEESASVKNQKSAILTQAQNIDEQGILKYIPNERVEQGLQQMILPYKGNLLLWGSDLRVDSGPGLGVSILSLETGEVLKEVTLSGYDIPDVQVCGDLISIADWADGTVSLLDETLTTVKEYQAEASNCAIYVSPDGKRVFSFTQETGIRITDMETGSTEVLRENATMLFASGRCGDTVSASYTDRETQMSVNVVVDLVKGTAEEIPFTGAFYNIECDEGIWMAGVLGEDNTYYLGKSQRPNSFKPHGENSMVSLLSGPTRLMTTTYDETGTATMDLYEIDGRFLSECRLSIEGAGLYYDPVWSEADGGYFFTVTDAAGKDMLLFWDLAVPMTGLDMQLTSQYQGDAVAGTAVSQELYERAAHISEAYGVEIKIADQTNKEFADYSVLQEMDENYISSALDTAEKVLSAYPDGFVKQLLFADQVKIEIQFTGPLTSKTVPEENGVSFTSFSGFASQEEGKNLIVLDVTYPGSLEQTFHHEIAHLIDYKLEFDAGIRDGALYSEAGWMALNPQGFVYENKKSGLPESIYTDGYEEWFIDIYSRTTIREDRARIFEYAMMGYDWAFLESPGRQTKLEYLSSCIRDAFDTSDWIDKTIWEQTLENVNIG